MRRSLLTIGLAVSLLTGCAGTKGLSEMDGANALVFGYIDMAEAPAKELTAFSLRQVLPNTDKPFWHMRTHEGVFYLENLPLGSYQLSRFGGPGGMLSSASFYWFDFPRQSEGFRVAKPGIHYLGSFKYKKAGSFFNPKFDIEPLKTPGEREAIEKILEYSKNTKWDAQLRVRLAQLGAGGKK
jgi:hypothetical protein